MFPGKDKIAGYISLNFAKTNMANNIPFIFVDFIYIPVLLFSLEIVTSIFVSWLQMALGCIKASGNNLTDSYWTN